MDSAERARVIETVETVRQRVERRTFMQDVTEPLTGRLDHRKVAAKFNNLEHAVDELADAVHTLTVGEDDQEQTA